jgi:hypothetical protein
MTVPTILSPLAITVTPVFDPNNPYLLQDMN